MSAQSKDRTVSDLRIPIIFVHLGAQPAPHLIDSIRQARRASRGSLVFAVLSEATTIAEEARDAGAIILCAEGMQQTVEHMLFVSSVRRRLGKKKGFWRFATERFFYLESAMRQLLIQRCLHLESDNLIFFDPAEIGDTLSDLYPGLAAPFANDNLCIPGIVFVSNIAALHRLNVYIAGRVAAEADARVCWYRPRWLSGVRMGIGLHDMNILADFRSQYGPDALDVLPMVPPGYIGTRKSALPHTFNYSRGFDRLQMIFDAHTIGPYLDGLNPAEHTREASDQMIRDLSWIDGSDFDFTGFEKCRPVVGWQGKPIRVASIHNAAKIAYRDAP